MHKLLQDGNVLLKAGRYAEAAHRYEYAIKRLSAAELDDKDGFVKIRVQLLLNLSSTMRRTGHFLAAIDRANQAFAIHPESPAVLIARGKAKHDLSMASMDDETKRLAALSEAMSDLQEAVKISPRNADLHSFVTEMRLKMASLDGGSPKSDMISH